MGSLRSPEKQQKRYSRRDANNLFLKYSFHDRILAETVHTVETEKIVSDILAKEYPSVPEAVFQSQVLNHVYGEVLLQEKRGIAGDISTLVWVQIQPGSILDREVNENRPTILQE